MPDKLKRQLQFLTEVDKMKNVLRQTLLEEREAKAADKLFSLLPDDQAKEYRELWEEFDRMETHDAMYAGAIDRLQPFLNNYLTDGHTWVKHGVSADKIYKRMAPVQTALPELWEFVEFVIRDSCEKGYIKP